MAGVAKLVPQGGRRKEKFDLQPLKYLAILYLNVFALKNKYYMVHYIIPFTYL
jgi:hypothetical protein